MARRSRRMCIRDSCSAGGMESIDTNKPDRPSIGYKMSVPTGCANRAVGTRLATRKPSDMMLTLLTMSATAKLNHDTSRATG